MEEDPQYLNHRYLILRSDSSRLYRAVARLEGMTAPVSPRSTFTSGLIQLQPGTNLDFMKLLSITSREQQRAIAFRPLLSLKTWRMRLGDMRTNRRSSLMVPSSSAIRDSCFFIVMAVDDDGQGVPVAFLLFSAPTGNRQTSAGYDTAIHSEMLGKWKVWLQRKGCVFNPRVEITDTDTKERRALLCLFPSLVLLLCKFHIRQCWTNKRHSLLGSCEGSDYIKHQVKAQLQNLEIRYVLTQRDLPASD